MTHVRYIARGKGAGLMKKELAAVLGALTLSACGSSSLCIARGTLVWTPRGWRKIEELNEQDTVWCVDPATGERVASPITSIRRAQREVMQLSGEGFSLNCTTDHPLYDPRAKTWAPAGDWVLGQRSSLLFVPDDAPPRVVEVSARNIAAGVSEVFDLSVLHELHNFVANGVLVHNKTDPRACPAADGGITLGGESCSCQDGGMGTLQCLNGSYDGKTGVTRCSCESP